MKRWPLKDLLDISQLTKSHVLHIFELASRFSEINQRPVKKVPILKGKSIVLFFAEPSTRTRTSFDMAGKRLSADTFSLSTKTSSLTKGETLKDTAQTLEAMHPDAIVLRHSFSGAAQFLAERLESSIINAGDGWHAHPTQALLDGFTLHTIWPGFQDRNILILGDVAHSRVARSDILLLTMLGANVRVCGPRTLLPVGVRSWPVEIFSDLSAACENVDAVICLRLQLERQQAGLFPDPREYARFYGLSSRHLKHAKPDVKIMHPGPINRGLEIDSSLADCKDSLILNQVSAGVAVRMALLHLYLTRRSGEANA